MDQRNMGWQILVLEPPFYRRLQGRAATVAGSAALVAFREEEPVRMPAISAGIDASYVGRCSSFVVDDILPRKTLKVLCESPRSFGPPFQARLTDPGTGNAWTQRMEPGLGVIPLPDWLSPLDRRQASFPNIPDAHRAHITLTPERQTACMILRYELRNLDLRRYEVRHGRPNTRAEHRWFRNTR
jgi:hypothetical protein